MGGGRGEREREGEGQGQGWGGREEGAGKTLAAKSEARLQIQEPCGRRRGQTPTSFPLTYTHTLWLHTSTQQ